MNKKQNINIEYILKQNNITKLRFAVDFGLSRPTLYDYINRFENDVKIPNDKHQIIFNNLFGKKLNTDDFDKKYRKLRAMFQRDRLLNLEDIDSSTTDIIIRIIQKLSKDSKTENKMLLHFVQFVSEDFSNEGGISKLLCKYFLFLNNIRPVLLNDYEKAYFGSFFEINNKYLTNPLSLDLFKFELVLEKRKQLMLDNKQKSKDIQKKINQKLITYIDDIVASCSDDDDIDELVEKVFQKIKE